MNPGRCGRGGSPWGSGLLAIVLASGACGRIGFERSGDGERDAFGIDDASEDAFTSTCTGVLFTPPTLVTDLNGPGATFQRVHQRADGLELWMGVFDGFGYPIGSRTRASRTDPWPPPIVAGMDAQAVSLSSDGLEMFGLTMSGSPEVHVWTRSDLASPFGGGVIPAGLEGVRPVYILDISADGLTLYLQQAASEVLSTRRPSRTEPFGPLTTAVTLADGFYFASMSADERELYLGTTAATTATDIYRRTRATRAEPFGEAELLGPGYHYPDLSHDGTELLMIDTTTDSLMRMQRTCP